MCHNKAIAKERGRDETMVCSVLLQRIRNRTISTGGEWSKLIVRLCPITGGRCSTLQRLDQAHARVDNKERRPFCPEPAWPLMEFKDCPILRGLFLEYDAHRDLLQVGFSTVSLTRCSPNRTLADPPSM